jgi:hypothetical protein
MRHCDLFEVYENRSWSAALALNYAACFSRPAFDRDLADIA